MQQNPRCLIIPLTLLFLLLILSNTIEADDVGEWTSITNITDPKVTDIAEFAVDEYNRQSKKNLRLEVVIRGETQSVVGENYRLVLRAYRGTVFTVPPKAYQAVVLVQEWNDFKNLTSFQHFLARKVASDEEWTPVEDISDPFVMYVAGFAVSHYDSQWKRSLKLEEVIKGYQQTSGELSNQLVSNYRLVLRATDGTEAVPATYQAVVKVDLFELWETFMTLTSFDPFLGICVSKPGGATSRASVAQRLRQPEAQRDRYTTSTSNNFDYSSSTRMKGLFKSKPRTPADIVRQTRDLLGYASRSTDGRESKREEKMIELSKNLRELKSILYGNGESEPVSEACAQLTQEFFREDTLRLLITCLPKLNLEARKDASQVVANLQRQQVNSRLVASGYLEANLDLLDILVVGYENTDMALHYGAMLRECIRHQTVARYVLESEHMKKFFGYIQLPNFDIAADASATFKELLTRHKSTVAEFLSKNYDWFFAEYNSKLLESSNYITRRQAIKLLGDILLDRSNSAVMTKYVSSRDNLRILMNLLRESSKSIQIEAFHVFKLFAAKQNKPQEIVSILVANKSKLLRLFADFKTNKEDEQFEADKAQVIREIAALEL
ncbi:hypothetical protein V6N11_068405 [Hibiscus sabdariffa]|uniref:Cystatin domain-containing protein n=2 Tax=Hibiscus sabdariffa TaxID=183260 RepID=A0ABR2AK11_9ROSI